MKTLLALVALVGFPACTHPGSVANAPTPDDPAAGASPLVFAHVNVVHPERDDATAVDRDATVVISGERISAVGPLASVPAPPNATVIDGKGKWLIPGLIDTHVHFFQSANLYTRPDVIDLNRLVPYASEVARNKARLSKTFQVWLDSGVTSVADVGGPFWNFEVRDTARRTEHAPRVFVAGPLLSMVSRTALDLGDPPIIKVGSPEAARSLARRELERHPDFVKVWFIHQRGDDLGAQEAIVRAGAETTHAAGVRLAVHATELETAKAALRSGADILVHSVANEPVDEEFIRLARERHALYTPTIFVQMGYELALSGQWRPTDAEQRLADPEIVASLVNDFARVPADAVPPFFRKLREGQAISPWPAAIGNLRRVWDAGITVCMGTDAGNIGTVHGPSVFREMEWMTKAGLTPKQILLSATVNGARFVGMEKDLGVIAPGQLADLVLLDADPLASVDNFSRIRCVIKAGKVVSGSCPR